MLVHAQIQKWGNSLALRLTGPLRDIPKFKEGMKVDIQVTDEGIQVRPVRRSKKLKLPYSETELLTGLTPRTAHADELAEISIHELGE